MLAVVLRIQPIRQTLIWIEGALLVGPDSAARAVQFDTDGLATAALVAHHAAKDALNGDPGAGAAAATSTAMGKCASMREAVSAPAPAGGH